MNNLYKIIIIFNNKKISKILKVIQLDITIMNYFTYSKFNFTKIKLFI